jgi:hypothetical protein
LLDHRLATALDLYAAQLTEPTMNVKFPTLVMSLEALCDPVPRAPVAGSLMSRWKVEFDRTIAREEDPEEFESLEAIKRELGFRSCNSIKHQVKTLVSSSLSGQSDAAWCSNRISTLYDVRSELLHSRQFKKDDPTRHADAQSIVRRVLRARARFDSTPA